VERPEDYRWSSYRDYIGQGQAIEWLKTDFILSYFGQWGAGETGARYRRFVEELVEKEYEGPLQTVIAAAILGTAEFVEMVTMKFLDTKSPQRDVPALRQLASRPTLEEILRVVDAAWHRKFSGPPKAAGVLSDEIHADTALILMGDWCSQRLTLKQERNTGIGREVSSAS
jgi:hypothetical protein